MQSLKTFLAATFLAVAPITAAACQQIPDSSATWQQASTTVPFDLYRGTRVVVDGTINGRPVEFLLDSGAGVTTVDRAYAKALGLPAGQKIQAMGSGGTVEAELVDGVTLAIGGVTLSNATVAVMDLSQVAKAVGRPMPVVLGRELFDNAVLTFDWAASTMTVADPKTFAAPAGARLLQLGRKDRLNTVEVSVAGLDPITALLDLGAGHALSLPRDYWSKHHALAGLRFGEGQSGGVGGTLASRNVIVPRVDFGGETFTEVPVVLGVGSSHGAVTEAKVGINLLRQFRTTMDLGRDRLYLEPLAQRPAFPRDRAGLRVDLEGKALVATQVSPQGPAAAAGLKAGDRILAVNGREVGPDFYEGDEAQWALRPAGTGVALTLGDGRVIRFQLADFY